MIIADQVPFLLIKKNNDVKEDLAPDNVNDGLVILRSKYLLTIGAQKWEPSTDRELTDLLNITADGVLNDTLYVFVGNTESERISSVLNILHKVRIRKSQVIVTKEYFSLPLPDRK